MKSWPSPELAAKQVARYEAAVVIAPPDSVEREYLVRQLAWWVMKLAEVTGE